ncbi:MAG TPA: hypothetical protein VJ948_05690 [Acidimicrobiia bacterium]|nr:hypothetical protein [Acidimicrobiia bacterium]
MPAFPGRATILVVVPMVLLAACGREEPDAAIWSRQWEALVAIVPAEADIGSPPDTDLCRDTLAALREQSAELSPAPNATITELVHEWVSIAEAAFFGCPPQNEDVASFEEAYQEMERIAESVETALANEG